MKPKQDAPKLSRVQEGLDYRKHPYSVIEGESSTLGANREGSLRGVFTGLKTFLERRNMLPRTPSFLPIP